MHPSELIWKDQWAIAWREFIAKRIVDLIIVLAVFKFTASEYDKLEDSLWIMLAFAFAASVIIYIRDMVAHWIMPMLGEEKRAPLSVLESLRRSHIQPEHIVPARLQGLKNLIDDNFADAWERIDAAVIYVSLETMLRGRPWFRKDYSRDLMDNAILRFTLESRRERGLASDDEIAGT